MHLIKTVISLIGFMMTMNLIPDNLLDMGEASIGISPNLLHTLTTHIEMHGRDPSVLASLDQYESSVSQSVYTEFTDSFNSLSGMQSLKCDLLQKCCLPVVHPELNLTCSNRLLLHGPPGTGKSTIAMCIAKACNIPLINVTASTVENKYYGEAPKLVAAIFSFARKIAPCVVFFDEVDGLIRSRSDLDASFVYTLKTELLAFLDGVDSRCVEGVDSTSVQGVHVTAPIVFIAATNNISKLDPALLRRLPLQLEMSTPNYYERVKIFKQYLHTNSKCHVERLASISSSFSGSDIKNACMQLHAELESAVVNSMLGIACTVCNEQSYLTSCIERIHSTKCTV